MLSIARRIFESITGEESSLSLAGASSVVSAVSGAAGRFVVQVVIAQFLGPVAYGQFAALRGWAELLSTLPNRGYQSVVVRFLPEYETKGAWARYRGLLRYSLGLTISGGVLLGALAIVVGFLVVGGFRLSILLALAAVPAWAAVRMLTAILQAQHQFVVGAFIFEVIQPALVGVVLTALWLVGGTLGLEGALGVLLLSIAFAVGVAVIFMLTKIPDAGRGWTYELDTPEWRDRSNRLYVSQLAIAVLGMTDILILSIFRPASEVALYSISTRISHLGRLINSGLEAIVSPRIAAAWSKRDIQAIQSSVNKTIALSTGPTIFSVTLLVIFREPTLGLVGPEYREAGTVLTLLLLGNVFSTLTGPSGYVIALTGHESEYARIMAASALLLVVACFVVAGPGGMVAVASVKALSTVGWNTRLAVLAKKKLGIDCYPNTGILPGWGSRQGANHGSDR